MYIGIELDLGVSVHGVVLVSLITYWGKGKLVYLLGVIYTYQKHELPLSNPIPGYPFTAQHCVVAPCLCHGDFDSLEHQKNLRTT